MSQGVQIYLRFVNWMEPNSWFYHDKRAKRRRHNSQDISMLKEKIAKGTTAPRVDWFLYKSWSNFIFRVSTKRQIQNLNQTWGSRINFNFKILTKPSIRISNKIKLHNLNQTSAAKYWPNFSFKISPKLCIVSWFGLPSYIVRFQCKMIKMLKGQIFIEVVKYML